MFFESETIHYGCSCCGSFNIDVQFSKMIGKLYCGKCAERYSTFTAYPPNSPKEAPVSVAPRGVKLVDGNIIHVNF